MMSEPKKCVEIQIPVAWSDRPIVVTIYGVFAGLAAITVTLLIGLRYLA